MPQIWIDDEHIGGYDDLMAWLENRPNSKWGDAATTVTME